jgi:hypothetical protein
VASSGGIAIRFNVTPPPGLYPLAVYGTIADPGFANWTLVATGNPPTGPLRLKQTGTALYLRVLPTGTLMMF